MSSRVWDICGLVKGAIGASGFIPPELVTRALWIQRKPDDVPELQAIVVPASRRYERESRDGWEEMQDVAVVFKVSALNDHDSYTALETVQDVCDFLRGEAGAIAGWDLESIEHQPYDATSLGESNFLITACILSYRSTQ